MPASPLRPVDAPALKAMLFDGRELALIDLREELTFSRNHLLWARSVPLSRLELRFASLVPRRDTRIVLCDEADGLVERAAKVLATAGYTDLSYLRGGIAAWEKAGFELFSGVNVPSKAFGEHIEHACHTPSVSAEELDALMQQRRRHGGGRQPPVRRIPAGVDPDRDQRAGRRAGAAHPRHRALAGDAGGGQLRRPHAQHHRRAIADQRRPAEQGGGAAQRHHGLDARRASRPTTARPSALRSPRPKGWPAAKIGGRARDEALMASCASISRGSRASGRRHAHALSVRRARSGRIRRRPFPGRGFGAGRPARAGDRPIRRHARRADRAGRRPGGARGDDGVVAPADGLARRVRADRERRRQRAARRRRCSARRRRRSAPSSRRSCPRWWRRTTPPWSISRSARPTARATSRARGLRSGRGLRTRLRKFR